MINIAPALEQLKVPIADLTLHPKNYRQGDVENIAASLSRFGQVRPVVVQASTMQVVAGNHTMKAAQSLDWTELAAVVVNLTDEEAEAYLVADNRASDKATNDDALLAPILERLMLAGKLEGTGYTPDDVDDMLSAMDQMPEVDAPAPDDTAGATTNEQLAERFKNRSQVALRQFVLMYDQDTATEVEGAFDKLKRAWGMTKTQDVALEALRRAAADPPVEGLTIEEAERANILPEPEGDEATRSEPVEIPAAGSAEWTSGVDDVTVLPSAEGDEVESPPVYDTTNPAAQVPDPSDEADAREDQAREQTTEGAAGNTGVAPAPVDPDSIHTAAPEA